MASKSILRTVLHSVGVLLLFLFGKIGHAGVHKSPNDHREYLTFKLANKMTVLVISDPEADKAAAAMNVAVGSSADPADRPGLAHFLEHMLFLGTSKYPEADGYHSFIKSHGGQHNAYTSQSNTNYYFDISADSLASALDRFAQFFIAPLLDETYVDRERHAVDAEYRARVGDDHRRLHAATRQVMNQQHGYSQFSIGTMQSLGGNVRPDLVKFYEQYYSANLMSLVVEGRESVEELKAMVERMFAAVPNSDAKPVAFDVPVFAENSLPAKLSVKSLKDERSLTLNFPVESLRDYWQEKPLHYISSLVGYEGHGSLLAYLKAQGWAHGLMASPGLDLQEQATFQVQIRLTEAGYQAQEQVVAAFFTYVDLLQRDGVRKSLYQEEHDLAETHFRFQETQAPLKEVSRLAANMQRYPAEHVLDAPYLMESFKPLHIHKFLDAIRPDNMLLTLQAPDVDTDQVDPWFNTGYRLDKLTPAQLADWQAPAPLAELSIRDSNPYITQDIAIKALEDPQRTEPEMIYQREGLALWHLQDQEFDTPKADTFFSLTSPRANDTARHAVMTALYTRLVEDQLNEALYDAHVAGFSTRIYPHMRGFTVRVSGYSEKQAALLERISQALVNPQFDAERFAAVKAHYMAQLENAEKDKPYNLAMREIFRLLLPQWTKGEKLAWAQQITQADLEDFVPQLLAENKVRMLTHGNLQRADALQLAGILEEAFVTRQQTTPDVVSPVVKLEANNHLIQTLDINHNDSAISMYFQGESTDIKARAEFALLSEIVSSPFYTRLRTEQQLGYIVFQTPLTLGQAPGLAFVVQSPSAEPGALEEHIEHFMAEMLVSLEQLDEDQLNRFKQSLIAKVTRQDKNLTARSNRFWKDIDEQTLAFDSHQLLAEEVAELSLADLKDCYAKMAARQLVVRSYGQSHKENGLHRAELNKRCDRAIRKLKREGDYFEV